MRRQPLHAGPCRHPEKGAAKGRTGVHRRSGRVTGAGRRGVGGEECGGVSAGGMAVAPPVRRRAFRVRSPTTPPDAPERGAAAADIRRTRTGHRAICRGYSSGSRIPDGDGFATTRGRPDNHLPVPRPGVNPARQDVMSRRTRQTAQPVHAGSISTQKALTAVVRHISRVKKGSAAKIGPRFVPLIK